jgi:hypothetical protein
VKELVVFCEGPTEQGFCRQVLQPHLFSAHDGLIHTFAVGEKRGRHVYGIRKYAPLKKFIRNSLKSRKQGVYFTTLIDLYALPSEFPGKANNTRNPHNPTPYAEALEKAFGEDIGDFRFLPHLQLHEYETMLFADPEAFRIAFDDCEAAVQRLKDIAASFTSVEHINDGDQTAPSKRIIELLPAYDGRKSSAGPDIAEFIGVAALRAKCPHLDRWLTRLENLDRGEA